MSQNPVKLFWEKLPASKRKTYRHIFNCWLYIFAAVGGVGIDELSEARWLVILLYLIGLAVFFSIIVWDYEKQKGERTLLFLRPWFLLIIFMIFAMGRSYSDAVKHQTALGLKDQAIDKKNQQILDFSNRLNSANNKISLYRNFDTRWDDLLYWGSEAWGKKEWLVSKQLIEASIQAESGGDLAEVRLSADLAEDNLMLNTNEATRYQQFRNDLKSIIKNIDDQEHHQKQNSHWNDSKELGFETSALSEMTNYVNFPAELKPDVEAAYTNIWKFREAHGGIQ